MVMVQYYSYNCNRCGNATKHQLFVLQCQSCGIQLCKKCAKGSLCLDCFTSLPDEMQKKYSRQLITPIIILISVLLAIAIPLALFAPEVLFFIVLIGIVAWCKDHGRLKTTPRSAVRKAQKIVAETRQRNQGISQPQPSQNYQQQQQQNQQQQNRQQQNQQQQNQQQQNQQKTYQKDPDSKYSGTFWN